MRHRVWNTFAALMALGAAASLLLTPIEVEGRGGRGGGGRGGGGGGRSGGSSYRGGSSMNRTPTMSRASSKTSSSRPISSSRSSSARPSTASRPSSASRPAVAKARAETRPAVSQGRTGPSRQTIQQRPTASNRADIRSQVNRYAKGDRIPQNIDQRVLQQKAENFSSKRSNQITQNRQLSDNVSQRLRQSKPNSKEWFDRNFFDRHNIDGDFARSGANLWRPAAWATLANWGNWGWSEPYYYDDGGYSYPVDMAYESSTATPQVEIQPMQSPTASTESASGSTEGDWLPLGVFAVASNANNAAYSDRFIQLAINRSGEIAGVLYNSATDAAQDITGLLDAETQKAYWSLQDKTNSPIASTGLYNLTEYQTPVNVHFSDGSDQTWTLVRINE